MFDSGRWQPFHSVHLSKWFEHHIFRWIFTSWFLVAQLFFLLRRLIPIFCNSRGCNKQILNLLITSWIVKAKNNAYVSDICGFLALAVAVFPSSSFKKYFEWQPAKKTTNFHTCVGFSHLEEASIFFFLHRLGTITDAW